ncbi:hypothetical protein CONPUDRAFT_138853 [Coniophora puteana RWD-64-598 SS2]|uniref:Uncharacterized protein n=1 Tax=Coniophora puteana (strain RWD-64-598) TaxID=741705 RepID=A0A5M3MI54_CONPW|nr:uncharacterized protein CONPUDRAFT_138853 [Coniophora puteana RWD-64-598 SS2]EIW78717.1 hypothetical protein CONPUDRAFT_138853 [Coniophora puteana RWD-64-598 SS2]
MGDNNCSYRDRLESPFIVGRTMGEHRPLCLRKTARHTVSVTNSSVTKPSNSLRPSLDKPGGFCKIYHGHKMDQRLQAYVDTNIKIPGAGTVFRTTEVPPNGDTLLPPTRQITEAICGMHHEEQRFRLGSSRPFPLVTDQSVQDVLLNQVVPLLNLVIQTRYKNTITNANLPPRARPLEVANNVSNSQTRHYFESVDSNEEQPLEEAQDQFFFPCWARPAPAFLDAKFKPSGLADFALINSPASRDVDKNVIRAHCEAYLPWVYQTEEIREIYNGPWWLVNEDAPYDFQINESYEISHVNVMLKMAFGQINSLGSKIGFFTNTSVLVFYFYFDGVRDIDRGPGNENNAPPINIPNRNSGLVLSKPIAFDDPCLLVCLQGMTFLALDVEKWAARGSDKRMVDILAPGDELEQIIPLAARN